jgi:uncharacterized Fe-S cluster protein YjdI
LIVQGGAVKEILKRYSNGEVTVVWQPHLCIHSGICARGLPRVFDPRRRPWVDVTAATTAEIVAQVGKCPSGALSLAPVGSEQSHGESE